MQSVAPNCSKEFQPAFEVELVGNDRDLARLECKFLEEQCFLQFKVAALRLLWTRATGYIGGWQRGASLLSAVQISENAAAGLLGILSPLLKFAVEALFRSRYSNMELPSSLLQTANCRAVGHGLR